MEEIVYLNGVMVPVSQAKISVMDYGFLYGYGLFETMRAYDGVVFRLDHHINRLAKSAVKLSITIDTSTLVKAVTNTLKVNKLRDARVRLTVSAGEGTMVPDSHSCTKPSVLVVASKYDPYTDDIYQRGFKVIVSSIHRNSQSPVLTMKTVNYMENLLARQQAKVAGVDDVLFLNEKGQLAEASASNIFMVNKNVLKTPPQNSGILPGITRNVILELALQMNIETYEADIQLEEIIEADEAFLTNSILEIMPLTNISGKAICYGKPGSITRRLRTAYKELVRKETRHQSES